MLHFSTFEFRVPQPYEVHRGHLDANMSHLQRHKEFLRKELDLDEIHNINLDANMTHLRECV